MTIASQLLTSKLMIIFILMMDLPLSCICVKKIKIKKIKKLKKKSAIRRHHKQFGVTCCGFLTQL